MKDSDYRFLTRLQVDLVCSLHELDLGDDDIVNICLKLRGNNRAEARMIQYLESGSHSREQVLAKSQSLLTR